VAQKAAGRATRSGHHYKRRRLELPEGGALQLDGGGTIERIDAAGVATGKWAPGDPEWARHAIRFGLMTYAPTVAPHGPGDPAPKSLAG
jgi:hypothetical protein